MNKPILLENCRLLDAGRTPASILIRNGKIVDVGIELTATDDTEVIDGMGMTAAPGLIDVHIQGAGGCDVLDGTREALATIAQTSAKYGVSSWLATTVYREGQNNSHLSVAAEYTGADLDGAELLGIHLEGPFVAARKRGMIQPDCLTEPSLDVLKDIEATCAGKLAMMTVAPELPGASTIIERLVASGVVASFGHSTADYEQTLVGFDAGISHATHLFNAMQSIHHRNPGPFIAIAERPEVTCQMICDGVHLHPAMVRFVCRALGIERIVPITDGMQAIGLGDGEYIYNSIPYESRDGTARYADGTLVGTALGLSQMLGRLVKFSGCTVAQAIAGTTSLAARILGISQRKGSIEAGKDADIVLLEDNLDVAMTIVSGKVVYSR